MKAKELQAEIEEALLRGMAMLMKEECIDTFYTETLQGFCRERAANLAMGLANRTISENTARAIPSYEECAEECNQDRFYEEILTKVCADLEGQEPTRKDVE